MREMKDSGVEWIGEIPMDWGILPIKQLFLEVNERCENGQDYPLLSVSEYYGVALKANKMNDGDMLTHAETLDGYKICCPDDLVMNIMLAWKSAIGVSQYEGIVSPAYCVYRKKAELDMRYYHYLFRTNMYASVFRKFSTGIIDSRLRLYPDKFLALKCQMPPFKEQQYMANYLDKKCIKIDTIVSKQQEIIEKLNAYKLSIITETVTKGLNPDVEMKDSGIDWIGEIPKDWSIHKLCWDYSAMLGKMLDVKKITGQHLQPYIKNIDVEWGNINIDNLDEMDFEDDEIERYSVLSGDLMICEGGEIGKCAIVPDIFPKGIYYQKALHRVRKRKKDSGNVNFLYYVIFCMAKNDCFGTSHEKATIAHLPGDALKQLRIPSPHIDEQKEIADFLDKKCIDIDYAIKTKQKIVDKIILYKKSLIYEVVTGKREVK